MTVTQDVPPAASPHDLPAIMPGLYGHGFIGLKGASFRAGVARLAEELPVLRDHLSCRVLRTLKPTVQSHPPAGLTMGDV
ncbi:hypothetical protein [Deinococcus sp. NW-56]|uniref:hypothetical protein n=1 Tax=Deinococcus sp. NW-56 TaxID=2080419 RepID=UPI000CF4B6B9|nr:hypothetical protein [Deinococcus sp. NW-56]